MAANTGSLTNTNNGGRYDDWFELYNPGASPANLDGYFLTDNLSNQVQFAIPPGYVIPPRGFLLVWADNAPGLNLASDPALHANFRLSGTGEAIGLFAYTGTVIDAVTFGPQFNDISQGRNPDDPALIQFMVSSTPMLTNLPGNSEPALASMPDQTTRVGQPISFFAVAADAEAPPQTLAFSLVPPVPAGASIDAVTGYFQWAPTAAQSASSNPIVVKVTDNGTPALSNALSFAAFVTDEPPLRLDIRLSSEMPRRVVVTWSDTNAILAETRTLDGGWIDFVNATSPHVELAVNASFFYRLRIAGGDPWHLAKELATSGADLTDEERLQRLCDWVNQVIAELQAERARLLSGPYAGTPATRDQVERIDDAIENLPVQCWPGGDTLEQRKIIIDLWLVKITAIKTGGVLWSAGFTLYTGALSSLASGNVDGDLIAAALDFLTQMAAATGNTKVKDKLDALKKHYELFKKGKESLEKLKEAFQALKDALEALKNG
jgi:hypothetical protein